MNKITLGLDLGTNSIGWALVDKTDKSIIAAGSRIIPMGEELSKFEKGQAQTKNAVRRNARGSRRLNKRYKQRRNKLIYVLQQLGMLPQQIELSSQFINPNRIDKVSILPIKKDFPQYTAKELIELKVKSLTNEVSLEELGRILYLFNQSRGYSGGGDEYEENNDTEDEINSKSQKKFNITTDVRILEILNTETKLLKGKNVKQNRVLCEIDYEKIEDTIIEAETYLDNIAINETIELTINISNNKDGTNYFLKLPSISSWRKKMENIERHLKMKSLELGREYYISEYYLELLNNCKWARIKDNVILRYRYESEFDKIWDCQLEKNVEFKKLVEDRELLRKIVYFIFPDRDENKPISINSKSSKKDKYRTIALEKGLKYLIKNQIIYYQRELKDQSHLISNCRYETDKKVVAKSHPIFQEYRIWEQINKLSINTKIDSGKKNKKGEIKYKFIDKTLPASMKEWIYEELLSKNELGFNSIFKRLINVHNFTIGTDFLNGIDSKSKIKTNDTKKVLKKSLGSYYQILELDKQENLIELWNILYNIKGNEYDLESDRNKAVIEFLNKRNIELNNIENLAIQLAKIKFQRSYSNLSLEAIEKLLPLVRAGKYFNNNFSDELHENIISLLNESTNDVFKKSAQQYLENNIELLRDGGILNAFACIIIYNKHTANEYTDNLIDNYHNIKHLAQGELRNPLAEQMVNECLAVVKDIWKIYGIKPTNIHIELARELKNSAQRRKKISENQSRNEKENERIKDKLYQLSREITTTNIEKYKIWLTQENLEEEYIRKYKDPSKSEIEKMKLWEEQGHISPYTGKVIPLSELFNQGLYDVDHIIPKSRYFDDSITNKVVCETAINKEKGNRTAMEYFDCGSNLILNKDVYINEVNKRFWGEKRKNLLATKIPEDPILRQIKDTQYIALRTKEELSKIVGSNNVLSTTGGITNYLKNKWGITDIFKELLLERYNNIIVNDDFIKSEYEDYDKKYNSRKSEFEENGIPFNEILLDIENFKSLIKQEYIKKKNNKYVIKDWSKRIDHRHHAIDAIIIACTEYQHIHTLNNLNKELQVWLDSKRNIYFKDFAGTSEELLEALFELDSRSLDNINTQLKKFATINQPWSCFHNDVKKIIENIIISQKPRDKILLKKSKNNNLITLKLRGELHEATNYGKSQGKECYRIPVAKLYGKDFNVENTIEKIVNENLRNIFKEHYYTKFNKKKNEAFSDEGINELNQTIAPHPPIRTIKIFRNLPKEGKKEKEDSLQRLCREKSYNNSLFVKTGSNYLFAVMETETYDKKLKVNKFIRKFDIITYFDAVNLLNDELKILQNKIVINVEDNIKTYFENKHHAKLLFTLKQGDYVYLPRNGEIIDNLLEIDINRIFIVKKFSGNNIYFLHHHIAKVIKKGMEFKSQDMYEFFDNQSIKANCIKININRLGQIIK